MHVTEAPVDPESVRDFLDREGVHTVECLFADTWGIPRGKRLSTRHFLSSARGKGFAMANVAFTWDMHSTIFPTEFVNDETGYPDMHVVPDLSTLRLAGWREGTAFCFCNTIDPPTHDPIPFDGRAILGRAVERVREAGYEPVAATELEFHLLNADWTPLYTGVHCYSMQKGAEVEPVVSEIKRALEASGILVESWNVEYGPAQVEVNIDHGPPIDVADATVILKYVVKQVAAGRGLRATFMPKPYISEAGNGLHIHQSLLDSEGRNAMAEIDDEPPLRSKLMRRYLAGLLTHQIDLQPVNCPTINAYKRVEDYSFAPTQVSWGLDHRLVGVRTVVDQGSATRVECRWGSADANPYYVLAGCLAAGADGLQHAYELPPMVSGDPHVDASLTRLPTSLQEALPGFERSAFARDLYGDVFVDAYLVMLRHELAQFARHVTDWEFERYREVM
ncbi:MAG TPA: glutamine synthetase family protein [Solirubrobacteraceae bacterium]|nr:glutamine synthetase family protein [Solirubrobacteraceae bacterium]